MIGHPQAVIFTQKVAISTGGIVGILVFIAGAAFILMYIRSLAHTSSGTRGKVSGYPQLMLRVLGVFNPMTHEVWASSYQFMVPYVIDSTKMERELGITATPWNEALIATADSMLMSTFALSESKHFARTDLVGLYTNVGWSAYASDPDFLVRAVEQSSYVVVSTR